MASPTPPTARRELGATFVVAALLAVVSLTGLLWGPRGLYADDPATAPAFLGQDGISLAVGIPVLLLAARAAVRGSIAGLVVWMGALFYVAYSYAFYVLDPRVTPLFPAYAALVALSTFTLLALLVGPAADEARRGSDARVPRRTAALYLAGMGSLFIVMWGAMFASKLASNTPPTTVEHIVWSLDFMFALPAMLLAAVLLWRRRPWGIFLGGIMLLKATLLGFTLFVTTSLAALWGVQADPGMTAAFVVLAVLGLAILVAYLRALRRPLTSTSSAEARTSRPDELVHG